MITAGMMRADSAEESHVIRIAVNRIMAPLLTYYVGAALIYHLKGLYSCDLG